MVNVLFGIIAGLGAALGLGGGTILILLLSFFTDFHQQAVQGINLIFFIPTSLVAIYMNFKNKIIDFRISKKLLISGSVGSMLGAFMATKIDSSSLRKYFGIFLILIAINGSYTFISQYIKSKKDKNNLQKP